MASFRGASQARISKDYAAIAGIIELWDYRNDDRALPSEFRS
jgi:hypothetical protein